MLRQTTSLLALVAMTAMAVVWAGCASTQPSAPKKRPPPIDWTPIEPDAPKKRPPPIDRTPTKAAIPKFDPLKPTQMRAHFIDVGQGDATLLEFPCAAVLIDTGGEHNDLFNGRVALSDYLASFFARRTDLKGTLALLLITHPHIDHTRGVRTVTDRYRVSNIVDNGMETDTIGGPEQTYLHTLARDSGGRTKYRKVSLADVPRLKGLTGPIIDPVKCAKVDPVITALWGHVPTNPGWPEKEYRNANNHSVAVRVEFGKSSFLFTGDLETDALHELVARNTGGAVLDIDVYKAGHHGSYNGTTRGLVKAMTPKVGVFSMGPSWRKSTWTAWRYGHPRHQAVRLLQEGCSQRRQPRAVKVGIGMRTFETWKMTKALYATGWDGTVVLSATAGGDVRLDAPIKTAASALCHKCAP